MKISSINPEIAQNICYNLWSWTSKNYSDRGKADDMFPLDGVELLQGKDGDITYAWGQGGVGYSHGLCSASFLKNYGSETRSIFICSNSSSPIARFTRRNCTDADKRMTPLEYLPLDIIAFPPNLNLTSVPTFNFKRDIKAQHLHRRKLTCSVFSNSKKTDSEDCYREMRQGSDQQEIAVFYWPSGGKTVVETNFGGTKYLVNGNRALVSAVPGKTFCYLNSTSGNHFCAD